MVTRILQGLITGLAMIATVSATTLPASADACLPPSQAPQGLSDYLGPLRAVTGGGTVVNACLMKVGNRYIYKVWVQVGGRVVTKTIDLATGTIR